MKKILILEDDSYRVKFFIESFGQHELKITENAQAAIEYLQDDVFDYIFLDNDLGPENGEGQDVANYLFENPHNLNNQANVIIHSWNIPAVERMLFKLPSARSARFNSSQFFSLSLDI